jgi:hypothetical protein
MPLVTLNEGSLLKTALGFLTEIAKVATVKFSSKGIALMVLNTDRIFMGVLQFRSSDFQHFVCNAEGIGCVNLSRLRDIMRLVISDQEEEGEETTFYGWDVGPSCWIQITFRNDSTHLSLNFLWFFIYKAYFLAVMKSGLL